jgi:hypothetical protein
MELYIILALVQGFVLGWVVHGLFVNYQVRKVLAAIAKEHNISLEEMVDEVMSDKKNVVRVPILFTEAVGNSIMLFNKETKQFVCQATSLEELAKNMMDHTSIKIAVVDHDAERMLFVDGKVKKDFKELNES